MVASTDRAGSGDRSDNHAFQALVSTSVAGTGGAGLQPGANELAKLFLRSGRWLPDIRVPRAAPSPSRRDCPGVVVQELPGALAAVTPGVFDLLTNLGKRLAFPSHFTRGQMPLGMSGQRARDQNLPAHGALCSACPVRRSRLCRAPPRADEDVRRFQVHLTGTGVGPKARSTCSTALRADCSASLNRPSCNSTLVR